MTTPDRLDALAAAATPGPWHLGADNDEFDWFVARTSQEMAHTVWAREVVAAGPTAEFIAACDPATIRSLVAENKALREAIREECADCRTPKQSGTRNGYTCPRHYELFNGEPMPTVAALHHKDGA